MNRAWSRIRPKIKQEQCSFVQDIVTKEMLSEWAIKMQKDLYLCFIDYTNTLIRYDTKIYLKF